MHGIDCALDTPRHRLCRESAHDALSRFETDILIGRLYRPVVVDFYREAARHPRIPDVLDLDLDGKRLAAIDLTIPGALAHVLVKADNAQGDAVLLRLWLHESRCSTDRPSRNQTQDS